MIGQQKAQANRLKTLRGATVTGSKRTGILKRGKTIMAKRSEKKKHNFGKIMGLKRFRNQKTH